MDILDIVDRLQERFGEQAIFEKARDFMFEYASQIRAPLPPIAARLWEVAKKFKEGKLIADERNAVVGETW
jgi:hypothetical protein